MTELTLSAAQKIVADALAHSRSHNFNPMGVVVLDDRGALKAAAMEDGTSLIRWKIAFGKAFGAVSWGAGSRKVAAAAVDRPHFFTAVAHLADGGIVPVAGGVLIRDGSKAHPRRSRRVGRYIRSRRASRDRRDSSSGFAGAIRN